MTQAETPAMLRRAKFSRRLVGDERSAGQEWMRATIVALIVLVLGMFAAAHWIGIRLLQ